MNLEQLSKRASSFLEKLGGTGMTKGAGFTPQWVVDQRKQREQEQQPAAMPAQQPQQQQQPAAMPSPQGGRTSPSQRAAGPQDGEEVEKKEEQQVAHQFEAPPAPDPLTTTAGGFARLNPETWDVSTYDPDTPGGYHPAHDRSELLGTVIPGTEEIRKGVDTGLPDIRTPQSRSPRASQLGLRPGMTQGRMDRMQHAIDNREEMYKPHRSDIEKQRRQQMAQVGGQQGSTGVAG